MSDEREAGIHWSVAVQEATKRACSDGGGAMNPKTMGEDIVAIAAEIWAWRDQCFPSSAPVSLMPASKRDYEHDPGPTPPEENTPTGGDLHPPDEWPEEGDDYNATQGPSGQAAPRCKCGELMEFTRGEDWTAYFCPNQTKSRDPRIQDEQKLLHPPVWL